MGVSTGDVWTLDANPCTGWLDLFESWAWVNGSKLHGMNAGNMDVGRVEWGDRLGRHVCWKGVIEE